MIKYQIGQQLKQIRSESGWSLSRAAEETGVSKAMLGQIERNESSPTISTLWKIATGFHKPLSVFIDRLLVTEEDGKVRADPTVFSRNHDLKAKLLFPFDPRFGFEMFAIKLLPEQTHLSDAHDKGVFEHIIIISGSMEVKIEGQWERLSEGDMIRFAADKAHGYRNSDKNDTAIFHNIIYYQ